MRRVEVRLDRGDEQIPVGTLAELEHRVYFEYAPGFLANPLPISPIKLPPRRELFEHSEREFAQLFGVFNDSLPDGWGLLLMDREFRKHGVRNPSPLDRLAYIGTRGMGALTYHPATGGDEDERLRIDLDALARQAERILAGSPEEVLPALRIAGGSPGGARPKVIVGVSETGALVSGAAELPAGYRHFLIKFSTHDDPPDIGAVEFAYSRMALAAGVAVPEGRLFETSDGGRYFGAERFDRRGNARLHMHTLGGLLHASHRIPSLDYEGFLRATLWLTRDQSQAEEGFRRMAFNVFAHNRDDHVKNFSYLTGRNGEWTLAPAYDLVFSHGPGGQHTMALGGEAERPADGDMLRVADAAEIGRSRAREIIAQVRDAVARWQSFAREVGVSDASNREIGKRIAEAVRRE